MSDTELAWTPAWKLKEMFASRALSPVEYAHFLLERVEKLEDLGAFITVFPEHLLSEAKAATDRIMRGGDAPPLDGLPVSLKDSIATKGQRTHIDDFFKEHDLLLCPVIARTAFECGVENVTPFQYCAYTFITNVAGYCGASVPIGFFEGMPVGLQIIARPGQEQLLLRAARAFERERPWAQLRPPGLD